jgi:hypothetical protein
MYSVKFCSDLASFSCAGVDFDQPSRDTTGNGYRGAFAHLEETYGLIPHVHPVVGILKCLAQRLRIAQVVPEPFDLARHHSFVVHGGAHGQHHGVEGVADVGVAEGELRAQHAAEHLGLLGRHVVPDEELLVEGQVVRAWVDAAGEQRV